MFFRRPHIPNLPTNNILSIEENDAADYNFFKPQDNDYGQYSLL